MTILVTGAQGSVGRALVAEVDGCITTDITTYHAHLDVTDAEEVEYWVRTVRPQVIYHLAGAKHAPEGEVDPAHVARVNIDGTLNVLRAAAKTSARVILTSTCKACDPETAYGASKLIAERAVLNASGVVVRFHNIPESSGNVFRHWERLGLDDPIPVTDCWRYFTPMDKAVKLLAAAQHFPSGRYAVSPGNSRSMEAVARELYPDRFIMRIPRRRGDRPREPLVADCETVIPWNGWLKIVGAHDPPVLEAAA